MQDKEIQQLWQAYDLQLKQQLNLNYKVVKTLNLSQARGQLNGLFWRRAIEGLIFMAISAFLWGFCATNYPTIVLVVAGTVLNVFATAGWIGAIREMALIRMIDLSGTVTVVQKQLEKLRAYGIQALRGAFLSIPFFSAYAIVGFQYFFGVNIIEQGDSGWLIYNIAVSVAFIPLAWWLYKTINVHSKKRWVKALIRDNGGKQVAAAMEMLQEIDDFREEAS